MEMHGLPVLIVAAIVVVPFWRICSKAGYPGWLSLLIVLPIANIALLYYLAFSEWPSQRREAPPPSGQGDNG